jgi:hypothetical protein
LHAAHVSGRGRREGLNIPGACACVRQRRPVSQVRDILEQSSIVFSSIFVGEVGIKVIAYGLFIGPRAYLKESWNVADFSIALIGVS